jgi:hypothetical protein
MRDKKNFVLTFKDSDMCTKTRQDEASAGSPDSEECIILFWTGEETSTRWDGRAIEECPNALDRYGPYVPKQEKKRLQKRSFPLASHDMTENPGSHRATQGRRKLHHTSSSRRLPHVARPVAAMPLPSVAFATASNTGQTRAQAAEPISKDTQHNSPPAESSKTSKKRECTVTVGRDAICEANIIVFHANDINFNDLPQRSKSHVWVLYVSETPMHDSVANWMSDIATMRKFDYM